ncbi:diacylglycerol kinase epsilon-like [Adelges cooleyi]|uniref:diacylglycerol kinase epsilon-like n=1 Tax=Adelges cooleyi TaxID=133065 RepID=UPI00217F9A9F|nr:diacylglycerol kinase epsilon-like [Adelges cooleyi]XP_050422915.1 diacylglycerol kinase epsilon-like [Adelges cooleyi]
MYLIEDDLIKSSLITVFIAAVVFFTSIKIFKLLFPTSDVADKNWTSHTWVEKPLFISNDPNACNVCDTLIYGSNTRYCDSCGLFVDVGCLKKANKRIYCKVLSTNRLSDAFKHHWVKSITIQPALCANCPDDEPDIILGSFVQCTWCQRILHEDCIPRFEPKCEFGKYRKYIIPPFCVKVQNKFKVNSGRHVVIDKVVHPGWPNWTPLFIFVNKKSGNNDGALIMSYFRRLLNPVQVCDVIENPPEKTLAWMKNANFDRVYILVAGGDGTVAGVLNSVHKLLLKNDPAVGIIPLGTGNDLSRVLGWGTTYSYDDFSSVLDSLENVSVIEFDRWEISVLSNVLKKIKVVNTTSMYNYFGIGLDAQITLNFHRTRKSPFYLFNSTLFNKMIYLGCGTQQFLEQQCKGLSEKIELYIDDRKVTLPDIESIVIVNIESWGAGVNLWQLGINDGNDFGVQSVNDGLLEVLGVRSAIHIAQLKLGLSEPIRIGQASKIKIKLLEKLPVQVDGEPWLQPKCDIVFKCVNRALVMKKNGE